MSVPRVRTAWAAVAVEMLADGRWHDRDVLVAAMCRVIPPERARHLAPVTWTRAGTRDDTTVRVARARRDVALKALRNLVATGQVERRDEANGDVSMRAAW